METWYHSCGYPILVSTVQKHGREVRVFFDSDPQRPGRRIAECPGCDRAVHLSNLVPELEQEDVDPEGETVDDL